MEDENLTPAEGNIGVTGENTPAEVLRYKFWKQVHNTAIYISECGGVITISRKGLHFKKSYAIVCKAMKSRHAYYRVSIPHVPKFDECFNFYPHRAVAEVYLHPKNLFEIEVDHLDGNINNYHRLNLEWVTHEENIRRAVEARRKRKAEKGGVSQ